MKKRFVIDTNALIYYFYHIFNVSPQISSKGRSIINKALQDNSDYLIIIPSVVFVEIFDKWFRDNSNSNIGGEEFRARFISEVFIPIKNSPNIEIRELDKEVLETFLSLNDTYIKLENRDRIILASAVVLNSYLITSDRKIKEYVEKYQIIPGIID
ncbi:hypothetical protein NIES2101_03960 [Calothrix sp. HK-06]|nr:hypothetical protein NIES2101_03960 [Calothrix sp. HK-06]